MSEGYSWELKLMNDEQFYNWFQERLSNQQYIPIVAWLRFNELDRCPDCKQVKRASAVPECRKCLLE